MSETTYQSSYFTSRNERTVLAAQTILKELDGLLRDKPVLDIGCGVGTWAATAERLGAQRVMAVDGPWVDIGLLEVSPVNFIQHDLSNGPPNIEDRFGLTIWLENAEHLPQGVGESVVDWVCECSDAVLFSAAIPGQGGVGHQNEQWQSYWAGIFQSHGFKVWDIVRPRVWTNPEIPYWYKQNMILYVDQDVDFRPLSEAYETKHAPELNIVHPDKWIKQIESLVGIKEAVALLLTAIRRRFG